MNISQTLENFIPHLKRLTSYARPFQLMTICSLLLVTSVTVATAAELTISSWSDDDDLRVSQTYKYNSNVSFSGHMSPLVGADLRFSSPQSDTSLYSETTYTELVHRASMSVYFLIEAGQMEN